MFGKSATRYETGAAGMRLTRPPMNPCHKVLPNRVPAWWERSEISGEVYIIQNIAKGTHDEVVKTTSRSESTVE